MGTENQPEAKHSRKRSTTMAASKTPQTMFAGRWSGAMPIASGGGKNSPWGVVSRDRKHKKAAYFALKGLFTK
jgi:hypothetical protein